jgi:hypothetical protein
MTPIAAVEAWAARFSVADSDGPAAPFLPDTGRHRVALARRGRHPRVDRSPWPAGRGLFALRDGLLVFQRGYGDRLSCLLLHGVPLE